ncbi:MAG TPA: methyltransferase domain-containing protein [Candidatus Limnocylindrales bacterium]|nr:methyltransferase domain-containing protein [Candidatus Limnocylindrales bacterium]
MADDRWADGDAYEAYIGRWSRAIADRFVDWLSIGPGARWVDVGCGSGALTATILARADPAVVRGVDSSSAFVEAARGRIADPRASFAIGDATSLPLDAASSDAVVSGLVLNFIPDLAAALGEMRRVAGPGATVAAYVWDYAGMELIRAFWDAAVARDPGARPLDEAVRFPICAPGPLAGAFEGAGLSTVETSAITVPTTFIDFDDYWTPFLRATGPAPAYVASLDDDARSALRDRLRSSLPIAPDGGIRLVARAWAVRGRNDR